MGMTNKEFIDKLTENIPAWKLVLIDKWTDFKVWVWLKTHTKEQKMGMTIEKLITFCEEEEQNHRVKCKRADDASGYTRSKDKNIRTSDAIREEVYGDFYKQIADTMSKYKKITEIVMSGDDTHYKLLMQIKEVVENGNND